MKIDQYDEKQDKRTDEWDGIWHLVTYKAAPTTYGLHDYNKMIQWCNEIIGENEFIYYGFGFEHFYFKKEEQAQLFSMVWK